MIFTCKNAMPPSLLSNQHEALWAPESIWTFWRREKISCLYQEMHKDSSDGQPVT